MNGCVVEFFIKMVRQGVTESSMDRNKIYYLLIIVSYFLVIIIYVTNYGEPFLSIVFPLGNIFIFRVSILFMHV